ncbi:MAG: glucose-1-phosphate adenylyltransferase [bacterium]
MNARIERLSTLIMAGGRGARLEPLTRDRAKPSVPFGGTYRIIDFTLSNCINSGIRRIHVLTQYKFDSLAHHLKMGWNIFHSEQGGYIDVIPAQQRLGQQWYRGTADAVYQNFYTLRREDPDFVLILAGDHVYKMDYSRMLQFHIETRSDVTVGVVDMPADQSIHFGVLETGPDGRILGFEEKPRRPKTIPGASDKIRASMGIYLFNAGVLYGELLPEALERGRNDFGKHVLPRLLKRRKVLCYPFEDENRGEEPYWRDIGTLDAFYAANMDLVSVSPRFNLYDRRWPVRTYQPQLPPVRTVMAHDVEGSTPGEVLDSILSGGCVVRGGRVVRSVLSPGVQVEARAVVEGSVLMDGVEVGRSARIRKAIIDKEVKIPAGAHIGYNLEQDRRSFMVTDSGVVVIPRGETLEPGWPEALRYRTVRGGEVLKRSLAR